MAFSTIPELSQIVECHEMGFSISPDGYIRLTVGLIRDVTYTHLLSGLDEEVKNLEGEGAVSSEICGYTEWVSQTEPAITLGWDWFLDCRSGAQILRRCGPPSSNVMAVDHSGKDLGYDATLDLLSSLVDEMDWMPPVIHFVQQRYTPPCKH